MDGASSKKNYSTLDTNFHVVLQLCIARMESGKLMVSDKKQILIEKEVDLYLGRVTRDIVRGFFDLGLKREG